MHYNPASPFVYPFFWCFATKYCHSCVKSKTLPLYHLPEGDSSWLEGRRKIFQLECTSYSVDGAIQHLNIYLESATKPIENLKSPQKMFITPKI